MATPERSGGRALRRTKPYESIGFGAMDATKPCEFIGFGAMDVTKPYEFIGFGARVDRFDKIEARVSASGGPEEVSFLRQRSSGC